MHRVLRCMICFLLICSLLVNFLPTRAKAITTGGVLAYAAVSVAASMLIGAGISIGTDAIAHSELAQNAVTALQAAGVVVTNGLMDVVALGSGLFGVKSDVIQSLFNWLHADSGAITDPSAGYMSSTIKAEMDKRLEYEISTLGTPLYVLYRGDTGYKNGLLKEMVVSQYPFVKVKDTIVSYDSTGKKVNMYSSSFQDWGTFISRSSYQTLYWGDTSILIYGDENGIHNTVAEGLTAGHIAAKGSVLATGYPIWYSNSVTIPNSETGEDETYYPIALGNSMEETQSFTQEQVWAGAGTYVDSESVPGTGDGTITVPDNVTLKDILAGVLSIPHAIATGIEKVVAAVVALPAAIVDGLRNPKPPDDHNNFALADLKNFFPFCIPFDLYAFFQLLNADPVAPVLSWEIQDLAGQTYSLSVDLAEWDSVAQLFRRLQLFLFITGLAAASRKFIKW